MSLRGAQHCRRQPRTHHLAKACDKAAPTRTQQVQGAQGGLGAELSGLRRAGCWQEPASRCSSGGEGRKRSWLTITQVKPLLAGGE